MDEWIRRYCAMCGTLLFTGTDEIHTWDDLDGNVMRLCSEYCMGEFMGCMAAQREIRAMLGKMKLEKTPFPKIILEQRMGQKSSERICGCCQEPYDDDDTFCMWSGEELRGGIDG